MLGNAASSKPLQCSRKLPATNAASDRRVSTFPPWEKILISRRFASHIQTMIGKLAIRDNFECLAFRRFTPAFNLRSVFQRHCISSHRISVSPRHRFSASPRPRVASTALYLPAKFARVSRSTHFPCRPLCIARPACHRP